MDVCEGGEAFAADPGSLPASESNPTPEQIEALGRRMRDVLAHPDVRQRLADLLGGESPEARRARRLDALADEVKGMRLVTRWEPSGADDADLDPGQ